MTPTGHELRRLFGETPERDVDMAVAFMYFAGHQEPIKLDLLHGQILNYDKIVVEHRQRLWKKKYYVVTSDISRERKFRMTIGLHFKNEATWYSNPTHDLILENYRGYLPDIFDIKGPSVQVPYLIDWFVSHYGYIYGFKKRTMTELVSTLIREGSIENNGKRYRGSLLSDVSLWPGGPEKRVKLYENYKERLKLFIDGLKVFAIRDSSVHQRRAFASAIDMAERRGLPLGSMTYVTDNPVAHTTGRHITNFL